MEETSHQEKKLENLSVLSEIELSIETTKTQLEIWTDCLIGGDNANKAYNLSYSIKLSGEFNFDIFRKSFDALIVRHESLRSSFSSDGRYMNILKKLEINIPISDISELLGVEKEEIKKNIIDEEVNSYFNLVSDPLIRVKLIKVDILENIIIITHHHIIGDGLSITIILEDLSVLYSAFIGNTTAQLKTPTRFSEYAAKVNLLSRTVDYKQTEDFWLNIYSDSVPQVELPIDQPRPVLRTYESQRLDLPIDSSVINSLKQLGKSAGCSLTSTILIALEVFLYKITGQNDLIIGFPTSGNRRYDMTHLVGDCANLLPLRTKINSSNSFLEYLKVRNPQLLESYINNQVSFGHLLQKLALARDPSRVPMVPVTLTVDLNRNIESEFSFIGLTYEFEINSRKYSSFELQLHFCMFKNKPTIQCSYNSDLFKEKTIIQMLLSFEEVLKKLITEQNSAIGTIIKDNYLSNYSKLNNTKTPYPQISLAELLSTQSVITPKNIAIEFHNTKISYRDLHIKVNQFAHYLVANGVQSGDYIAVSFPRSPELVYSILAIIQCGAAYLPLDHEYPIKRIEYMMEDSGAKFLLTGKALSLSLPKCSNTILIDDAMKSLNQYPSSKLDRYVDPEDVLYLLYTSGSTGKPKGAKITNRNLVNLFCSLENEPGIEVTDRVPFISTISFDIASFELFFPLYKGAVLVIPSHETASDGRLLNEMLEKEKISLIIATPTTYQMLIDAGWKNKLPIKIWCCGEPLPAKLAKELIERSKELWTLYGPTEVTIFSSYKRIKTEDTIISVGSPIANMQYYIVDEHMNLLPPNTIGEIAIGGDGVGKGYLNRTELTAAKYIPNIFSKDKNAILYLSGDLGKLLLTNEVMCLGRVDHQVKVRGHRIEIGEIEHVLMSIDNIKSAIVLAKADILVAFLVLNYKNTKQIEQIRQWRNYLSSQLPNFMVPHEFHILDKMPTTLNDKIDRKKLLDYKSVLKIEENFTAPRSSEEKLVAEIWQESLKKERIDIFSNFFEMGGHSIMAVNVMMKIEKKTGIRIPLSTLFQYSTIEKFAKLLIKDNQISSNHLVPMKPEGIKPPLFIVHGAGLNILNFAHLIKHFDQEQPIYGFQGVGPEGYDNWFTSIEAMAAEYIRLIIKINPSGPYALAGFSFGGVVAFEMARQLEEKGRKVTMIALLDTYVDSSYYYKFYWQKVIIRYIDRTYRRIDYLKEILTSWKSFKKRVNSKKIYLQKKYFGLKECITDQDAIALQQFSEADFMVNKIVNYYQLLPHNLEVDLFRAKDDDDHKLDPKHLGWKKAALKGVNTHIINGDHLNIVAPPNDIVLANMLQNILNERHGNC
ncbi:amino acid adenylation domain-containing protein [Flavobacterium segetis]|uniref:Amino acid adenylation domain-containing protein n=1 Tax=Flavobacterium segetis TaxID=271157 RepID=A0A1M5I042_9FLAO|nr:non-ribosomal peptide synthetase [Flavobacterium segetis]SHG21512.1 amino acid adenylation domain-containing protein [Flavobacterium segetis]